MPLNIDNGVVTPMGLVRPEVSIDRQHCKRVVPMKVLCFGLGRTGTASLRLALSHLGYSDVHHMTSILLENPTEAKEWVKAFEYKFEGKGEPLTLERWDAMLGHCMATSDFPSVSFADELAAAYPDAKIVLTVRDSSEVWLKSMMDTIQQNAYIFEPPKTLLQAILQTIAPAPRGVQLIRKIYQHSPVTDDFPNKGQKWYIDHNEHIRELAARTNADFLEFNVKEGWEPLCEFLGTETPDFPFPRVNDTKTWQETLKQMKKAGFLELLRNLGLGFGAVAVAATSIGFAMTRLGMLKIPGRIKA